MQRLPGLKHIYSTTRDFFEAFAGDKKKFTVNVLANVDDNDVWRIGFITKDDMEIIKARQNVANNVIRLNPKLDFKVNDNLNITLGGTWDYRRYHSYSRSYALFNSENNPLTTQSTWRTFLRIQQKFGKQNVKEDEKSQSIVKNAYFT